MRTVVVGMGVQGRKRTRIAGNDVVATVDPYAEGAQFKSIEEVALNSFDCALVCTPDQSKFEILKYLLSNKKHLLVEKPLLAANSDELHQLEALAKKSRVACYTAYNHRFEPHLITLKRLLENKTLGKLYFANLYYGNGTARDVRNSPWRDKGLGVLSDLGSHLLDLSLFLFGERKTSFTPWRMNRFENKALDHVILGSSGEPQCDFEMTLLSWKNHFSIDLYGESGSAHIQGLCKWGPSKMNVRRRILPSGKPEETEEIIETPDPTWKAEYEHFKKLCEIGTTNLKNDIWIQSALLELV